MNTPVASRAASCGGSSHPKSFDVSAATQKYSGPRSRKGSPASIGTIQSPLASM